MHILTSCMLIHLMLRVFYNIVHVSVTVFKDYTKEEGEEEPKVEKIKRPKIRIVKMRLCILLMTTCSIYLYCLVLREDSCDRENGDYEILSFL